MQYFDSPVLVCDVTEFLWWQPHVNESTKVYWCYNKVCAAKVWAAQLANPHHKLQIM